MDSSRPDVDKATRAKVLRRDKRTCQMCFKKRRILEVHHILKYSVYSSVRNEESNLITLCKKCHKSIQNKETYFIKYFAEIIKRKYE